MVANDSSALNLVELRQHRTNKFLADCSMFFNYLVGAEHVVIIENSVDRFSDAEDLVGTRVIDIIVSSLCAVLHKKRSRSHDVALRIPLPKGMGVGGCGYLYALSRTNTCYRRKRKSLPRRTSDASYSTRVRLQLCRQERQHAA